MTLLGEIGAAGVAVAALVAVLAGCSAGAGATAADERSGAAGVLGLLPDEPELRRHLLLGDLGRLRASYPGRGELERALGGVWLPNALSGSRDALWQRTFGLGLDDVRRFASAGFHPGEVTVAEGAFDEARVRAALRRYGHRERDGVLARGEDGSIDPATAAGRLVLGSLNRVVVSSSRIVAASTTALARGAASPSPALAEHPDVRALVRVLGPVTSAIVLDASLVRPPSGAPAAVLSQHAASLFAAGVDDRGPARRTLKVVLVYADEGDAADDAGSIEGRLPTTELPGLPGARFADVAQDWTVARSGRALLVTATLLAARGPWVWRELVERGDLAVLVRPAP